jgi:diacylglycerol kinase family enzyme
MRALLVVNPRATSTSAAGRDVLAAALASAVKLDVVQTEYRGHAGELAARATTDGVDLVVAHGGDGTVNEVVNGIFGRTDRTRTPMIGIVPGGAANVFARALGLPVDPVEATHRLLLALEAGHSRTVGLGTANGRWFTFNAGVGWDADVVRRVDRRRGKEATSFLYARMAMLSYFRLEHRTPRLTVEVPDEEPVSGIHAAFVSNTDAWTYAGSFALRMNPAASFDTGLGLTALGSVSPVVVGRHVAQLLGRRANPQGRHVFRRDDVPWVRVRCAEPMRVQVDGDYLGVRTEVEFRSVPGALRIAV